MIKLQPIVRAHFSKMPHILLRSPKAQGPLLSTFTLLLLQLGVLGWPDFHTSMSLSQQKTIALLETSFQPTTGRHLTIVQKEERLFLSYLFQGKK